MDFRNGQNKVSKELLKIARLLVSKFKDNRLQTIYELAEELVKKVHGEANIQRVTDRSFEIVFFYNKDLLKIDLDGENIRVQGTVKVQYRKAIDKFLAAIKEQIDNIQVRVDFYSAPLNY